ncbi:FixH family protein [Roseobacter sinensis]|uniref:FixH family protein n=1 Tax=Roseobacter sinensis TaxID=2931391 RepID=A0ABT3BF33_9RHOB|nr:FixH family protein [Roseobacter sp. WL0113]MCV3271739.1 FixH family protein [Roseobacter sp. WL0113]
MTTAPKQLTGRHVALIFVSAFTVIIAVNLTLAYSALSTFPGLEVKNSYVASQHFDKNRAAQQALGWSVLAQARGDEVVLSITDTAGRPVQVAELDATLGRATHVRDDRIPAFVYDGADYVAPAELAPGNWNLRMKAVAADGTVFQQRVILRVPKGAS